MAVTTRLNATGAWQAVATAGDVALSTTHDAVWAITAGTTEPQFVGGHYVSHYRPVSLTLTGSERLWVKAPAGDIFVTPDAAA